MKSSIWFHAVGLLAVCGLVATGCSFSESSGSISDSVSSPFKSSSRSSSGDDEKGEQQKKEVEEQSYESDVRDYTVAFLGSSSSAETANFFQGLGRVAERHGVTNWEQDQITYVAIGRGLAKANVNRAQATAYAQTFSNGDAVRAGGIEAGYAESH